VPLAPDSERQLQILYAGPGLSGRTTTLERVREQLARTREVTLEKLSLGLADLKGQGRGGATLVEVRFSLPCVEPAAYRTTATTVEVVLRAEVGNLYRKPFEEEFARSADGFVFVMDSQTLRREANLDCLEHHRTWISRAGRSLNTVACALQYNKRDLPDIDSIAVLDGELNPDGWPSFPTVARNTVGILAPLDAVLAHHGLPAVERPA